MKTAQKVLLVAVALGLLVAAGCKKPEPPVPLSLHRSRIFLMGRLLAGETCNVRVIWRKAPDNETPVTVTADLSEIGGDAAQELTADNQSIWRWSGQVVPPSFGEKTVRVTALDGDDKEYASEKTVLVHTAQSRAIAIDCGGTAGLALKPDGAVVEWLLGAASEAQTNGEAVATQLDVPEGLSNVVAIASGYYFIHALRADGTVVSWGNSADGSYIVPNDLSDIVAVAASSTINLALKADGTVTAWGDAAYLGLNIPQGLSDVVALAAGSACAHALRADGTVTSWLAVREEDRWAYSDDYCDVPEGIANVVAVAGAENTLALKEDGSVVMWGGHGDRVPRRAGSFRAKAIAAGYGHWMALLEDGTVMLWWRARQYAGLYYVSPERLKNIIAIADNELGSDQPSSLALTAAGGVLAWEDHWDGQYVLAVPDELK